MVYYVSDQGPHILPAMNPSISHGRLRSRQCPGSEALGASNVGRDRSYLMTTTMPSKML